MSLHLGGPSGYEGQAMGITWTMHVQMSQAPPYPGIQGDGEAVAPFYLL